VALVTRRRKKLESIFSILMGLFIVGFWAFIFSFVPVSLYLLLKNPWLFSVEENRALGIYFIEKEFEFRRRNKARSLGIRLIYGVCFLVCLAIYIYNWVTYHKISVAPFNILSVASVLLFGLSVFMYVPMAIFLVLRRPWQFREDKLCLEGTFIFYGIALLVFSLVYALYWVKGNQVVLQLSEIGSALLIIAFSSAVFSYLPVLLYVFIKAVQPFKVTGVHMNIIFVIYSVCFLIFSAVYVFSWAEEKKIGIEQTLSKVK
jgi:hypothetical protein